MCNMILELKRIKWPENTQKVTVRMDEDSRNSDYIQIKVNGILSKFTKDADFDFKEEMLDYDYGDSDMEESFIEQTKSESVQQEHNPTPQLKKRPKKKKVMSKITPYPCEHCGKTLIGRGNLVAHIKRIHLKKKDHICKICRKAFNTSSALESHMLAVHTRRCESCQEYVIESVPWSEGMNMKTLRQVICQCGEFVDVYCHFGRRKVYEDETEEDPKKKRKYNDQTKYACQHCGKLFVSKAHCLRHARKHTGIKDIHCEYCAESFRYENSLKKHLQSEHRIFQTPFCKICRMKFDNVVQLEKHNREHHGLNLSEEVKSPGNSGSPENKLVKVVTKLIPPSPKVKVVPVTSATEKEASFHSYTGTSQQEGALHGEVGSLQKMLGTSSASGEPEVAMRTISGHALDKDTYELVQQALQGDQLFTEDGNTIIIRTLPT